MESTAQNAQLNRRVGADGKSRPAHIEPPPPTDEPPDVPDDNPPDTTTVEPERDTGPPVAPDAPSDAPSATEGPPDAGTDAEVLDGRGEPVTDDRFVEVFRRRPELAAVGREISAIKSRTLAAIDGADPLYAAIHRQSVEIELDNARRAIERSAPHAICHYCGGAGACIACKDRGWLDIETYEATK